MWQFIFGVYFFVGLLSFMFLWSTLVLSKKSDHNIESPLHSMAD